MRFWSSCTGQKVYIKSCLILLVGAPQFPLFGHPEFSVQGKCNATVHMFIRYKWLQTYAYGIKQKKFKCACHLFFNVKNLFSFDMTLFYFWVLSRGSAHEETTHKFDWCSWFFFNIILFMLSQVQTILMIFYWTGGESCCFMHPNSFACSRVCRVWATKVSFTYYLIS